MVGAIRGRFLAAAGAGHAEYLVCMSIKCVPWVLEMQGESGDIAIVLIGYSV